MMTIRTALQLATQQLTQARQAHNLPVENPRLDAHILLSFLLSEERSFLYTHADQPLDTSQEHLWHALIARRAQGEPVAYLVGSTEFYGLEFKVDQRVLIPRPETELLVEAALRLSRKYLDMGQIPIIADIGTGSGAIPISLAIQEPRLSSIYAIDISPDALAVAHLNCEQHNVKSRIQLLQSDLLDALPEPVDLLLANLPYIGTNEQASMLPDVLDYEPHLALFSGPTGLDLLHRLLQEAPKKIREGAILLLEMGYQQRAALTQLVEAIWPQAHITCIRDYAGWERILQIEIHEPTHDTIYSPPINSR
ncbi:MAG: peptide chain release factor N(5)-glutamine methyltransferase [Ktedonobacteraceae bacterium]